MLAGYMTSGSPTTGKAVVPVYVDPTAAELGSILRDPTNQLRTITLLGQQRGHLWAAAAREGALHHFLIDWLVANGYPQFDPTGRGDGVLRKMAATVAEALEAIRGR
jgi:hypothetical protein